MYVKNCKFFSGYKPCEKNSNCNENCKAKQIVQQNILLVHLGALGAVLRSTCLLRAIRRKYPNSRIIWVTDSPGEALLRNNSEIDLVYTTSHSDLLELSLWDFATAFVIDKSRKAGAIIKNLKIEQIFGFSVDSITGSILPSTKAAEELWELGLCNEKKFFVNKNPETRLVHEALELGPWKRDEYLLELSAEEQEIATVRKLNWKISDSQPIIGINTGCSSAIPYKKLSVIFQRTIIMRLRVLGLKNIVLLGGKEDTGRNKEIARGLNVIESPTELGLRDGLCSVAACDIVITGDSLGMHIAIAFKKFVIAWFGPTCEQEIDLYDRGIKIISKASCHPCWKRTCDNTIMCYDQVDIAEIENSVFEGVKFWQKNQSSSYKRPFLETSY